MKQTKIHFVIILFIILGCNKDDEIPKLKSGYFILTEVKNSDLKNTKDICNASIKNEFLLGDLKASKEFYFLLSNSSDNPIYNIKLNTDNAQFSIMPEGISYLPGKNSNSYDSFIPLITLGIIHGKQLNGVGNADLLPMGENSSVLTITGKTIEDGDSIITESEFRFKINAKIMDITLSENGNEINLLNPIASFTSNLGEIIRYYYVSSEIVKITNIGNVDITVTIMDQKGSQLELEDEFLLPQNQSSDIIVSESMTVVTLKSNGTITDYSRIRLGDDGNGYFGLSFGP